VSAPFARHTPPDLIARLQVLADFIERTITTQVSGTAPIAVGFSNGAIMGAALLLMRPEALSGAVLMRPLLPFSPDVVADLPATPVPIIDSEKDIRRSPGDGQRLAESLMRCGARVTYHLLPVGHPIAEADKKVAGQWLKSSF
jgi:phospholipase/carboxylesterase